MTDARKLYYKAMLEAGFVIAKVDGEKFILIDMPVYDPIDTVYTYNGLEDSVYKAILQNEVPDVIESHEGDNYYLASDGIVLFESKEKLQLNDKEKQYRDAMIKRQSSLAKDKIKPVIDMLLRYRADNPDQGILEAKPEDIIR